MGKLPQQSVIAINEGPTKNEKKDNQQREEYFRGQEA